MARYRKVDPRIWNDKKFRALSDDGKLAFLFILTHPQMTSLGAMRATLTGLADELSWEPERMRDAMLDAIRHGMVVVNSEAKFVGLPNFLKYNEPEGPNSVTKAWIAALDLVPECSEKNDTIVRCRKYLDGKSDGFRDAIGDAIWDAFSMPCPIQEQEPEQKPEPQQEQKRERDTRARDVPRETSEGVIVIPPQERSATAVWEQAADQWKTDHPTVNVKAFERWIAHVASPRANGRPGRPLGPEQRSLQARFLAQQGNDADQLEVVEYCISVPWYTLAPIGDIRAKTQGMSRASTAQRAQPTDADNLEKLKAARARSPWKVLREFRDPNPGETSDQYGKAMDAALAQSQRDARPAVSDLASRLKVTA
jgi:hypothetical protein